MTRPPKLQILFPPPVIGTEATNPKMKIRTTYFS